jgi:hydantoinase/carbamoylase family amidase
MKSNDSGMRVNGSRLLEDLEKMKEKTETPGKGVTRFSYGAMDREARDYLRECAEAIGLFVKTDPVGNLFFGFPEDKDKPVILAGSHIDTVQNGGWLDGIYGTLSVLEALRRIREEKAECGKTIQLVVFAEEEGSNFGSTLTGSKFLTGKYGTKDLDSLKNQEGVSLGEILAKEGYSPYDSVMLLDWRRIQGMLELHIEQGPILESHGVGLGIVDRIYGMKVNEFTLTGVGNHAGASPMKGRQDALAAAAAGILEVERCGRELGEEEGVATVGRIQVLPNGSNVIPGQATFTVEVRSANEESIHAIMEEILLRMEEICNKRNIRCHYREVAFSKPDSMNPRMVALLEKTATRMGEPYLIMNSGAVHDACMLAPFVPTGMIFVPSIGGRSHVPQEDTRPEDLIRGADYLLAALLQLADCK